MKNEIEQQIFEKMKAKDFGESMCNETKRKVLRWVMQQLRKHDVIESDCDHDWLNHSFDHFGFLHEQICGKCGAKQSVP